MKPWRGAKPRPAPHHTILPAPACVTARMAARMLPTAGEVKTAPATTPVSMPFPMYPMEQDGALGAVLGGSRPAAVAGGSSPAWAGSWPEPPPESKATRPRMATRSARRTTRCPCRSRRPGLQATNPASASSAQSVTEFTSFLGTWRHRGVAVGGVRGWYGAGGGFGGAGGSPPPHGSPPCGRHGGDDGGSHVASVLSPNSVREAVGAEGGQGPPQAATATPPPPIPPGGPTGMAWPGYGWRGTGWDMGCPISGGKLGPVSSPNGDHLLGGGGAGLDKPHSRDPLMGWGTRMGAPPSPQAGTPS